MLAAAALSHYDGVGPGEAVGSEHTLTSPPLVSCFRPPLRESTEYLYCTRTFVQFIENIEHITDLFAEQNRPLLMIKID